MEWRHFVIIMLILFGIMHFIHIHDIVLLGERMDKVEGHLIEQLIPETEQWENLKLLEP